MHFINYIVFRTVSKNRNFEKKNENAKIQIKNLKI